MKHFFDHDVQLNSLIFEELSCGEELLWTGRPDPEWLWRRGFQWYWLGIPWTGIASYMSYWFMEQWGYDFLSASPALLGLLIGVLILLIPPIEFFDAKRVGYAVTNNRFFIVRDGRTITVESMYGSEISEFKCREWPDGRGDLVFAEFLGFDSEGKRMRYLELKGISNVRSLENLIRSAFPQVPVPVPGLTT